MDLVHREMDRSSAAPEFVALDIGGPAADLAASNLDSRVEILSGKNTEREKASGERNGDPNSSSVGVAVVHEKQAVSAHADGSPKDQFHHPSTPTAGAVKRRRPGRRIPAWRDPRKILFAFAAVSSVGTLILLYFTLSMGKTTGARSDGQ